MQKKIVALAVAGLSTAAFAQSSVTLSGNADGGVINHNSQTYGADGFGATINGSSTSFLAISGTEDLGGGLKASFSLEHGLDSDTGAVSNGGVFWGRASWVQLEGSFGAVRLGNWFPDSYFSSVDRTSNHNHDTGTSSDALFSSFGFGTRTNKVGYFSPTVGGFGFIGYLFLKLGCEPAPLLLGFILGPMMEENLRRALLLSRGDWSVFVTRPLSGGLLAAALLLLIIVLLPAVKSKREEAFVED